MADHTLARNLQLLCGFEKSVSELCRAVDINRQQFSKYLNATSQPSPYNLRKICDHFSIRPADIYLPHEEFADRVQFRPNRGQAPGARSRNWPLLNAFPGDRSLLRRYIGYYLTHCHSFSWEGRILRAVTQVFEQDGMICSKTIERTRDPHEGALYLSKYDGQMSLLGNRIFVVEHQSLANDAIVETVLLPAARSQLTLLRGITFGLSSKQRNPYVSRCVWKYLGPHVDPRTAMRATGLYALSGQEIDPKVARILGQQVFPNDLLHYELEPHGAG